jgi:hypothetical protein
MACAIYVGNGNGASHRLLGAWAADVARLIELGATLVHEKNEWDMHWFTLADIEGNEFCVG